MTALHSTNLGLSELLSPFIYLIVLAFTGLGVFVVLGLFCACCVHVSCR